jgi:hypothetical protein
MEYTEITEFPAYEISEEGNIRNKKSLKILSQSLSSKGYYQINIANKSRRVHRLLAETFINNPNLLETVNHINGDKLDNRLENLEWMSRSDNAKHSREVLGNKSIPYSKSNKEHHLKGKTGNNSKKVISNGVVYNSAYSAALYLFGDKEKGKQIRQAIKRGTTYRGINFNNYGTNSTQE